MHNRKQGARMSKNNSLYENLEVHITPYSIRFLNPNNDKYILIFDIVPASEKDPLLQTIAEKIECDINALVGIYKRCFELFRPDRLTGKTPMGRCDSQNSAR